MDSQCAREGLEKQQARIATLLHAASELLVIDRSSDATAMAALRWQLMRVMREYQLFKHREIFDPLAASPDQRRSDMARCMKTRCLAMGEAYAAHIQRWSDGTAASTWDCYAAEARDMVSRIRQHLTREHAEALVLLADVGRTRQIAKVKPARCRQVVQHK